MGSGYYRSDERIFLGYSLNRKTYHAYNLRTNTIMESSNIIVDDAGPIQTSYNDDDNNDDDEFLGFEEQQVQKPINFEAIEFLQPDSRPPSPKSSIHASPSSVQASLELK